MDGKDVVNKYYEYYNASNIDGVMSLMAEDCKYHDMIYSDPFEGHEEIRAYFDKVFYLPAMIRFITMCAPNQVGVPPLGNWLLGNVMLQNSKIRWGSQVLPGAGGLHCAPRSEVCSGAYLKWWPAFCRCQMVGLSVQVKARDERMDLGESDYWKISSLCCLVTLPQNITSKRSITIKWIAEAISKTASSAGMLISMGMNSPSLGVSPSMRSTRKARLWLPEIASNQHSNLALQLCRSGIFIEAFRGQNLGVFWHNSHARVLR